MNTIIRKAFSTEFKALDEQGIVEAVVSTYGPDLQGDQIMAGAFAKTIAENGLPSVVWSHNWDEPIGVTTEVEELAPGDVRLSEKARPYGGMLARFQLLIADVQRAREAYALIKAGAIREFSIGFSLDEGGFYIDPKTGLRAITTVAHWTELSPVLRGAAVGTSTVAVKSGEGEAVDTPANSDAALTEVETVEKAGRVLSAANLEKVEAAISALSGALEALETLRAAATTNNDDSADDAKASDEATDETKDAAEAAAGDGGTDAVVEDPAETETEDPEQKARVEDLAQKVSALDGLLKRLGA